MPTRNINLTDHFDDFVDKQIDVGRYRNASEVFRAGLHLLEQQTKEEQAKLRRLKSLTSVAIQQLDQGAGKKLSGKRQVADLMGRIGRKAAKSAKRRSKGD